jgi:hypothetical protein
MSATVLLLIGLAIGWWFNKARTWYSEVKSARVKIVRYRQERNRSMAMTALLVAALAVLVITFTHGG